MTSYDVVIKDGIVVDGTGAPRSAPTSASATAGSPRSDVSTPPTPAR